MRVNLRLIAILLIIALLTCTGCWSRREIEGLAYILVLGIDKTDDGQIFLIAQVGLPAQDEGDAPIQILTAQGRTITEAFDNLFGFTTKRPFLSHLRLVVLSENLAQDGVSQVLDFMRRDIRMRLNTKISVTPEDLQELLEIETPLSSQPALAIIDLFNFNFERSRAIRVELMDMVAMLLEPDLELALPLLGQGEDTYTLGKTAVFASDKMVATLDQNQTTGLLFLQDRVQGGVLTVPCGESGQVSVQIISSSTHVETLWQDEALLVRAWVTIEVQLGEQACRDMDGFEQTLAHYVINRMDDVIDIAKDNNTDFLGLAFRFRRSQPALWRQVQSEWAELLVEGEYDLRCRVNLRRQGQTVR